MQKPSLKPTNICTDGACSPIRRSPHFSDTNYEVQILNGIRAGFRFPLTSTPKVIGRGVKSDVTIPDLTLSRSHVAVSVDGTSIVLEDLGSSNGSFVSERRLKPKSKEIIKPGAIIRLGSINLCATLQLNAGTIVTMRPPSEASEYVSSPRDMDNSSFVVPEPPFHPAERRLSATDEQRIKADIVTAGRRLNAVLRISEILGLRSFNDDLSEEDCDAVLDVLLNLFTNAKQVMLLRGRSERSLRFISARARDIRSVQASPDDDLVDEEFFVNVPEFKVARAIVRAGFDRQRVVALPPRTKTDADCGLRTMKHHPTTTLNHKPAVAEHPAVLCIPLLVRAPSEGKNSLTSLHSTLYGPSFSTLSKHTHDYLGLVLVESEQNGTFTKKDMEIATAVGHQLSVALKSQQLVWEATTNANIRRSLTKYLPQPLVDQVMKGKKDLVPQGVQGTVLFSDIVGFTALSESMPPTELFTLMNEYLRDAVPCISFETGTIDKFIGDAIMALFGISHFIQHGVFDAESPLRAIRSALSMQNRVFGFQHASLTHPLRLGIGIHTGPMVAGNIGAADRMEYTVLGDVVNTTQRIESTAMAGAILVSEESYRASLGFIAQDEDVVAPSETLAAVRMPPAKAKNKTVLIELLSIRGIHDQHSDDFILSIPCRVARCPALLTRRIDCDKGFVLVTQSESADLEAGMTLSFTLPEIDLEPVTIVSITDSYDEQLQPGLTESQVISRASKTSVVQLSDHTLHGLLDQLEPLKCTKTWDSMPRKPAVLGYESI
ncbi:Adenylate and Guanylate cyclase catalytic domain [Carpediemonas membranifera]|uniref:Adenylate and Guanylate cyclase catalytic domain n=1 Tax=Carpediemonas membranifera TaxID=201153 RepID=A0A8J6DYW9_9EUKA|nr:Adenylate and Guanylate cyclase catalytic domain [Carpediemonas membranifera]|eukprot:KAG9392829.1 Adenylate and Guanylate cyclase catalytic domain [Carpediemonas membranifera]